mmetsp:Transcript_70953/g.140839  ORF Transcript_70953/g.140839 Transcript_70953/m.140839 type:complete len:235 (-) Transcript_70953:42-746(-)
MPFQAGMRVRRPLPPADPPAEHWFVVRGPRKNVDIAEEHSCWATTPHSEWRLQRHVAETWTHGRVMLLFLPVRSRCFCAAAEVVGLPGVSPPHGSVPPEPPWELDGVVVGPAFEVMWEVPPSRGHEVPLRRVPGLPRLEPLKDMTQLDAAVAQFILRGLQGLSNPEADAALVEYLNRREDSGAVVAVTSPVRQPRLRRRATLCAARRLRYRSRSRRRRLRCPEAGHRRKRPRLL